MKSVLAFGMGVFLLLGIQLAHGLQPIGGPTWAKNQPIYEINPIQFSPEGTFKGIEKELPRLKALGVGIIWLMPIYPSGTDPKSFGSFYCVKDYRAINPLLGTAADLKSLVEATHAQGMHLLLDWVPNHSSFDNALIQTHPEFYKMSGDGVTPLSAYGWKDVAWLKYVLNEGTPNAKPNQPLWDYMQESYSYWLNEFKVDGFRCDVAWGVDTSFWNWVRPRLEKVNPDVFMLAEAKEPRHHPAFDMTYDWYLNEDYQQKLWAEKLPATKIDEILTWENQNFPVGAIHMRFINNHDYNWFWRLKDKYGDAQEVLAVQCATFPGKPLIYNGDEFNLDKAVAGNTRTKAPMVWPTSSNRWTSFYTTLFKAWQNNPALWGGEMIKLPSGQDTKVYAYLRREGGNQVLCLLNLSTTEVTFSLPGNAQVGDYTDLFDGTPRSISATSSFTLKPWGYQVSVKGTPTVLFRPDRNRPAFIKSSGSSAHPTWGINVLGRHLKGERGPKNLSLTVTDGRGLWLLSK